MTPARDATLLSLYLPEKGRRPRRSVVADLQTVLPVRGFSITCERPSREDRTQAFPARYHFMRDNPA